MIFCRGKMKGSIFNMQSLTYLLGGHLSGDCNNEVAEYEYGF
jgi:hypothetical protein